MLALRGTMRVTKINEFVSRQQLPTAVAARQRVPAGGEYDFNLAPGPYVIDLPHYLGGNVGTHVAVAVRPKATVDANLPNDCL